MENDRWDGITLPFVGLRGGFRSPMLSSEWPRAEAAARVMEAPVPAPRLRLALHPHNIHVSIYHCCCEF